MAREARGAAKGASGARKARGAAKRASGARKARGAAKRATWTRARRKRRSTASARLRLRGRVAKVPVPRLHASRQAFAAGLAVAVAGGGFLLARDSSLFAVRDVRMTGVTGPAAPRMAAALEAAARKMTTLHVDGGALRRSVATFPQVRDLRVSAEGRNGLRVDVVQYRPVGAVSAGGRRVPVAADGTLLHGLAPAPDLATVPIEGGVAGRRLTSPAGLQAVAVLDAAPPALRTRIGRVTAGARGLGVSLRKGPDVYFGSRARLAAKWAAAAGVLADPDARGARYLDVRVPERPAAGGLPPEPDPILTPAGTSAQPKDAASAPPSPPSSPPAEASASTGG